LQGDLEIHAAIRPCSQIPALVSRDLPGFQVVDARRLG
jgi:hypothetical protein